MELRDYLRILRKNWILILVCLLVGTGASAVFTMTQPRIYHATSEVFVSAQGGGSVAEQNQGASYTRSRVISYVQLTDRPVVLQGVIDELGLNSTVRELSRNISVTNPTDTTIISITVSNEDPALAADIANATSASLSAEVTRLETLPGTDSAPVQVTPVTSAAVPDAPSSPVTSRNLALGAIGGLVVGVLIALLLAVLDTRIRSSRDLDAVTDSPVIGAIPMDPQAKTRPIIMKEDPQNPRSEAFRALRTNLQFIDLDGGHIFIVTSSIPGEGKSTTSVNLAIALADAGKNTVLIDGDLRKPKVAEYLGIEGGVGLTDVLIGRAEPEDVFQQWGNRSLLVLPSGKIPPNPSELLGSDRMRHLLDTVSHAADVVIIDCPPLLPVTDAAILARETSGAIVAVAAGKTHRNQLDQALENLENVGAKVAGLALTMVPTRGADAFGYSYGYGYGYGHDKK